MARVPASRSERYACTVSVALPVQCRRLSVDGHARSPTIAASVLDRQREHEPAATAALTLHPDPRAVHLDEAFRERESEPRASEAVALAFESGACSPQSRAG
jgi:hypothetical protein